MDDRKSVLGTLRIEGNDVIVATSGEERHYNRADVQSIIPGGIKKRDYWSGKWSLGLAVRSGNTDQSDIMSYLMLQRRSPGLRTQLQYRTNYGSFEGTETSNNQQAYLRHDIFVNDKVHLLFPLMQYYRDKLQNIEYRLTPGAGMGLQIFEHGDMEWDIAGGGGYQYTKFSQIESGEDSSVDGGALLAGTNFNWDLKDSLDLALIYRMTFGL